MKKYVSNKAIVFTLLIMLVLTFNTGIVFADTGITYPSSTNLIEKLSHPATGEGIADGLDPDDADRANSYSWTLSQLDHYVYIGSNRNILTGTMYSYAADYNLDPNLFLKFMDDISNGDIPTDDLDDYAGRMFRYNMDTNSIEQIYQSPYVAGYRGTMTFTDKDTGETSVYFGTIGARAQVLRFGQDFNKGDAPEIVYEAETGYVSVRAMTQYEDSMCIGVLSVSEGGIEGNLKILQSTSPAIDQWKEIATIDDFAPCNPRTDEKAAAQSGIWDMVSYNGSIYAFIGTGYMDTSEENGYCMFKGTYDPTNEAANDAGWVWKMLIGPLEDEYGNPTGAFYPRGMGNPYDGSASPFLYTDPNGEQYVYVGTFDSIFDGLFGIFGGSYQSLYLAMHPAKIYRFDKNDNWEMVIGNPDEYFSEKIGNYYAGFSNSTEASVYSPNMYIWRMAEYKGELFAGTLDSTTLLDYVVPPFDIDIENYTDDDLLAILDMISADEWLPPGVVSALVTAVKYADTTSEAAAQALDVYEDAQEVAASGDAAYAAADNAYNEARLYILGMADNADEISTALHNCEALTSDFAEKATDAAAYTSIAAAGTTASLAQAAAESAAAAATHWDDPYEPHTSANVNEIYNVRDDVSAAAISAYEFRDQAASEYDSASAAAIAADTAVKTAKSNLTEVMNEVNELLDTITAEQYADMSSLLKTIARLGYEGSDQIQELIYILELRVTINENLEAKDLGCSVYRTADGLNFTPVTTNGFNDKFNYGLRTFLPTTEGLFMGMANPFYGAQLWKLGDIPPTDDGGGGGGGGGRRAATTTITESAIPLGALTLAALNLEDHFGYVLGYENGTIRPENSMTRAEVATIFYRLLTDETRTLYKTNSNDFSDVASADWFNTAVSTLVNAGVLTGYNDGTFRPDANVSRAEFATILSKFSETQSTDTFFSDIGSHWAKDNINTAYANGWVTGYSDNTFRPNKVVTRAEVMTMVNRLLQRVVRSGDMLDGMTTWSDNPEGGWYYEAVQEAGNSHNHEFTTELVPGLNFYYEKWTELIANPDYNSYR